ncbi:EamA family transporter [Haloarchaeobius amylolyticus]|uniref:EamA family transporter n=1 Tax=Haloarchaeobius amylolyticus TaxID=1198296 RepID=UPI002270464F|nr:DMT family transporter [Haloarchaeobius amylolyticus]
MSKATVLFAGAAMVLYAGWAFFAKLATRTVPAEQAVVYTYVAGLVAVGGYILLDSGGSVTVTTDGFWLAAVSGLCLGLGTLAYYTALTDGSVGIATSISGMYLLFATLLGVVFLNESLGKANIAGIGFAVVAVVLLAQ